MVFYAAELSSVTVIKQKKSSSFSNSQTPLLSSVSSYSTLSFIHKAPIFQPERVSAISPPLFAVLVLSWIARKGVK